MDSIFRAADALSDPVAERPEGIKFVGSVSQDAFEFIRWTPYRNSVRPRLQGTLRRKGEGTVVDARMRVPPFALIAVLAWSLVIGVAVFMWLSGIEPQFRMETVLPVALFLLVISLFPLGANLEIRKAEAGLATIIGARSHAGVKDIAP